MNKNYVEGFTLYGLPLESSPYFINKTIKVIIDGEETLKFKENTVNINDEEWDYHVLQLNNDIFLITIHMLAKEVPQYINYVIDVKENLVTRVNCLITVIEKGSTVLSDSTNLVVRNIEFGYMGDKDPIKRHHFTHELCDAILETAGTPGNVVRYYIHSDTKISYYQKEWPLGGNPIDKDGLGMGEASFVKLADGVYIITFTKHSHGNQPFIVWDSHSGRYVANFAGVSRQSGKQFVTTATSYLRKIY